MLFGKEMQSKQTEIFNDANSNLINLFRCIKYHPAALADELQCTLQSREIFEDFKQQLDGRGLTDIQRAAKFLYLIKTSFGCNAKNFATAKKSVGNVMERFPEIQNRLSKVIIENRDFERLINLYDSKDTLFYLDPPYHTTEKLYDCRFSEDDHYRLKSV